MDGLTKLERELKEIYKQAAKEAQDKVDAFYAKFKQLDAIKQRQVKEGKLDKDVYLTWRKNKMLMGQKYQDLVNTLTKDMTNANKIAASIVNGYTPEAYANGMNFGTYEIEHGTRMNTSFSLYNRQAVEKLIREDPDIIPWVARVDIPKDLRWNRQHITNAITQGILQGESIPKVAKRLQGVAAMNNTQAVRTARTAMTAANNAGHLDAFERAQKMGIKVKKQWLAALDSRTRDSHAALDGESVPLDKKFSNGLMYPGDPSGKPAEVYNCRCRQIADIEDVDQGRIDDMTLRNDYKLGNMSYGEWKAYHEGRLHRNGRTSAVIQFNQVGIGRCKSVAEVNSLLNGTGYFTSTCDLSGCDLDSAKSIASAYERVFNEFPFMQGQIDGVTAKDLGDRTYAQCHWLSGQGVDVNNASWAFGSFKDVMSKYEHDVTVGWHPYGTTAESIVVHELGHALDGILTQKGLLDSGYRYTPSGKRKLYSVSQRLRAQVAMSTGIKIKDMGTAVSRYGATNEAEWFAECLAEYLTSAHPRKVAAKFGEMLKELVKNVI